MSSIAVRMFNGIKTIALDVYATGFGDEDRCVVVAKARPQGTMQIVMRMNPDEAERMADQLKAAASEGRRRFRTEETMSESYWGPG